MVDRPKYEVVLANKLDLLKALVPDDARLKRNLRIACNQVTRNRTLAEAVQKQPEDWAAAVVRVTEAGLDAGLNQAAVAPFWNKNAGMYDFVAMVMYEGKIELFYRSGKVKRVWYDVIKENDPHRIPRGTSPDIIHEYGPAGNRGKTIYAYACAELMTGGIVSVILDEEQIEIHRKASKTKDKADSMWNTNPDQAWRKTTIHELGKLLPKSYEMMLAQAIDNEDFEPNLGDVLPVGQVEPWDKGSIEKPQQLEAPKAPREKPKAMKQREPVQTQGPVVQDKEESQRQYAEMQKKKAAADEIARVKKAEADIAELERLAGMTSPADDDGDLDDINPADFEE